MIFDIFNIGFEGTLSRNIFEARVLNGLHVAQGLSPEEAVVKIRTKLNNWLPGHVRHHMLPEEERMRPDVR